MELELKNISVTLSKKDILKSINLKVNDGEFISLLGASGCGKSTLLKTIAGIIYQNEGSIILNGKVANKIPTHKRKTVIVFQDFRLFPNMTVLENISFPLKMMGVNRVKRKEKALELLKKVKLEGYEGRGIEKISGGQMQRVALARALAANPSVLLLDEPFSSLDINLRKEMRELVLDLQREYKITTILVTHDQEEALTMSERIAFMNNGNIIQYSTPEVIFKNPVNTIVADYFSKGIYIDGEIMDNKFTSTLFNFDIDKYHGKYKCLIRPLAVEVSKSSNGEFKVIEKVYQGDNYLIKLVNDKGLKLESILSDSIEIDKGDRVDVKLNKERLIFIPRE
ncbi:ABC transporter ATP-binding protein [Tissierella creatinophila]|uniref:ABC-type quaternary amine transporter n=1 Tax=Tissierella creatinophila DSM 6911 TaxID=1123403 RepID=A0A1U7M6E9_TISCR|nr:ABC transporter ATP-binding protein [Tissierella creatinophila]OLS02768.1 spermidine/putrescine import ATP-binding protein PotA [Tissierella creatinophila DSM 6911]